MSWALQITPGIIFPPHSRVSWLLATVETMGDKSSIHYAQGTVLSYINDKFVVFLDEGRPSKNPIETTLQYLQVENYPYDEMEFKYGITDYKRARGSL